MESEEGSAAMGSLACTADGISGVSALSAASPSSAAFLAPSFRCRVRTLIPKHARAARVRLFWKPPQRRPDRQLFKFRERHPRKHAFEGRRAGAAWFAADVPLPEESAAGSTAPAKPAAISRRRAPPGATVTAPLGPCRMYDGRSSRSICVPSASTIIRSTTFSNSRTFPGQYIAGAH